MKTPGYSRLAASPAALLLALACGCTQGAAIAASAQAVSPATANGALATPDREGLLAFAARIGVTCETATTGGGLDCIGGRPEVGDYYDVELHPSCEADVNLARVGPHQVELRDRIPPIDQRTVATLDPGALLCVQAIGRAGEHVAYYYVKRIDQARVIACRAGEDCPQVRDVDSGNEGWVRAEGIARVTSRI